MSKRRLYVQVEEETLNTVALMAEVAGMDGRDFVSQIVENACANFAKGNIDKGLFGQKGSAEILQQLFLALASLPPEQFQQRLKDFILGLQEVTT